jgi:hypothetical protein
MNERENFASEREGNKRKIKTKNTKSHRERREKSLNQTGPFQIVYGEMSISFIQSSIYLTT